MLLPAQENKANTYTSVAGNSGGKASRSSAESQLSDHRPAAALQRKQLDALSGRKAVPLQRKEKEAPLLQPAAGTGSVVQRYKIVKANGVFMMGQEKRKTDTGDSFLSEDKKKANIGIKYKADMRISDDQKMAIEDGGSERQAKTFYATADVVVASNQRLKQIASPVRLAVHPGITIKAGGNTLLLVYPIDLKKKQVGDAVTLAERCNEAAPYIANSRDGDDGLKQKYADGTGEGAPKVKLLHYLDAQLAAVLPLLLQKKKFEAKTPLQLFFYTMLPWVNNIYPELEKLQGAPVMSFIDHMADVGKSDVPGGNDQQKFEQGVNRIAERYIKEFVNKKESAEILKKFGLNEFIDPSVGDVLSIRSVGFPETDANGDEHVMDHQSGKKIKNPFGYHFATVIAKSGADYITMENYARGREEGNKNAATAAQDPRYYFQMFGPEEQSFHSANKAEYPNAMTLNLTSKRKAAAYDQDIGSAPVEGAIEQYNSKLSRIVAQSS